MKIFDILVTVFWNIFRRKTQQPLPGQTKLCTMCRWQYQQYGEWFCALHHPRLTQQINGLSETIFIMTHCEDFWQ